MVSVARSLPGVSSSRTQANNAMDATEFVTVDELQCRANVTARRLAFLIRSRVIVPDVTLRNTVMFKRSRLWELKNQIHSFQGI